MVKHVHADLGFWCEYCQSVQHVSEYGYETTDEHYIYTLRCPSCRRLLTLRQTSIMATIRRQCAAAKL